MSPLPRPENQVMKSRTELKYKHALVLIRMAVNNAFKNFQEFLTMKEHDQIWQHKALKSGHTRLGEHHGKRD